MNSLKKASAIFALALMALFGAYALSRPSSTFADFTPVQGTQFYLAGAGITATANTIQLTSFKTPDGRLMAMSMFGATGYGSLEPGTSKLEDITFTGITQNANGTATLTGVSRGMDFVSPYTASTTLAKAHSGGSTFILTNTAGFYGNEFGLINSATTVTGQWTFSTFPITPSNATSSFDVAGISQLATGALAAASTATSTNGTNAPLVLPSKIATSTWNSATAGNVIPVTGAATKTIDNMFIATSTLFGPAASSSVLTQAANGTTIWQQANDGLMLATTTSVNMKCATTTLPYNATNLTYITHLTGWTNNADRPTLNFNTDTSTNYSWRNAVNNATTTSGTNNVPSPVNDNYIRMSNISTTSPSVWKVDIWNEATQVKTVNWTSTVTGPGTVPPSFGEGAGIWNNTSNLITTIVMCPDNNSSSLITAGTKIFIYGSAI